MAVPQPQVLLVLNDVSGTTAVNDGTDADATVTLGVDGVGYSWNTGAGSFDGYWRSLASSGANMAQIDMTGAHTYPTTLDSSYVAFAFDIDNNFDTGASYAQIVGGGGGGSGSGNGFNTRIGTPAGGGDFDLTLEWRTGGGFTASRIYSALSYDTIYQVVSAIDTSVITSVDAKFKLNSGSILAQSEASGNWSGEIWPTDLGRLNGGAEWDGGGSGDTFRGIIGNFYYFAGYRGSDAFLADADVDAINADPTVITGWPSGAPLSVFVPSLSQRNRRHTGRYS